MTVSLPQFSCLQEHLAPRPENLPSRHAWRAQGTRHMTAAALAPCGHYTAQGRDNQVFIWRGEEDSHPVRVFTNGFGSNLSVVNWSFDSKVIVAGSVTGEVLAWRLGRGTTLLSNRLSYRFAALREVSLSPTGRHLAVLATDLTVHIWDVPSRTCVELFGCSHQAASLEWAAGGDQLITTCGEVWTCPA